MINLFFFFKYIFDGEFFLFGSPSDLKICKSCFGLAIFWQFLLKILFFHLFDCSLDVIFCPFVDFSIYVEMAWFEFFLNNLSLMLNFSAISLSNHSLLVFYILAVFKGAISLTTSINFWKKSLYALFILWYFS